MIRNHNCLNNVKTVIIVSAEGSNGKFVNFVIFYMTTVVINAAFQPVFFFVESHQDREKNRGCKNVSPVLWCVVGWAFMTQGP